MPRSCHLPTNPRLQPPRRQPLTLSRRRTLLPNLSLELSTLFAMSFMHSIDAQYLRPMMLRNGGNMSRNRKVAPTVSCSRTPIAAAHLPIIANIAKVGTTLFCIGKKLQPKLPMASLPLRHLPLQHQKPKQFSPDITFLNTAMVTAINGSRSCMARIAIDTGAISSLISEALASVKRHPHRLAIEEHAAME